MRICVTSRVGLVILSNNFAGEEMASVWGLFCLSPNFPQNEFSISLAVAFRPGFLEMWQGLDLFLPVPCTAEDTVVFAHLSHTTRATHPIPVWVLATCWHSQRKALLFADREENATLRELCLERTPWRWPVGFLGCTRYPVVFSRCQCESNWTVCLKGLMSVLPPHKQRIKGRLVFHRCGRVKRGETNPAVEGCPQKLSRKNGRCRNEREKWWFAGDPQGKWPFCLPRDKGMWHLRNEFVPPLLHPLSVVCHPLTQWIRIMRSTTSPPVQPIFYLCCCYSTHCPIQRIAEAKCPFRCEHSLFMIPPYWHCTQHDPFPFLSASHIPGHVTRYMVTSFRCGICHEEHFTFRRIKFIPGPFFHNFSSPKGCTLWHDQILDTNAVQSLPSMAPSPPHDSFLQGASEHTILPFSVSMKQKTGRWPAGFQHTSQL